MARISRVTQLPGPIHAAEELWYDLNRRAAFVEGFGQLVKVEGRLAGRRRPGRLEHSGRRPRGVVAEKVDWFEARTGQTLYVEDEELRGTQTVRFEPAGAGQVRVSLAFDWELKEGGAFKDWVLVRRRVGEAMRRTLVRYRTERIADLDDSPL